MIHADYNQGLKRVNKGDNRKVTLNETPELGNWEMNSCFSLAIILFFKLLSVRNQGIVNMSIARF